MPIGHLIRANTVLERLLVFPPISRISAGQQDQLVVTINKQIVACTHTVCCAVQPKSESTLHVFLLNIFSFRHWFWLTPMPNMNFMCPWSCDLQPLNGAQSKGQTDLRNLNTTVFLFNFHVFNPN